MISRVSPVANLLSPAVVQFERAAGEVVRSAEQDAYSPPARTDMVGAMADMMSARFAFSAALVAARTSNDMVAQAIDLGGYAHAN